MDKYYKAKHKQKTHINLSRNILKLSRRFHDFKSYGLDDLPKIQKAINKEYGDEKFNIMVFNAQSYKTTFSKILNETKFKPIFEGNHNAISALPILMYPAEDKWEYCTIKNLNEAFGYRNVCLKCKRPTRTVKHNCIY